MDIVHIPDGEILYRYLKPEALPPGQNEIPGGVFMDGNLSCDWEKYQKEPDKSIQVKNGKSIILAITITDEIRNPTNPKNSNNKEPSWNQKIIHDPVFEDNPFGFDENLSHSLIRGKKRKPVTDAIVKNTVIYKI
jgi:hypothetical protein